MSLTWLTEQLKKCHDRDQGREVFLVAVHEGPAGEIRPKPETGSEVVGEEARDRDIWSLVGPVALQIDPARFEREVGSLPAVGEALRETMASGSNGSGPRPGCGQKLVVLVRDGGTWHLTGTLSPDSVVGTLEE